MYILSIVLHNLGKTLYWPDEKNIRIFLAISTSTGYTGNQLIAAKSETIKTRFSPDEQ